MNKFGSDANHRLLHGEAFGHVESLLRKRDKCLLGLCHNFNVLFFVVFDRSIYIFYVFTDKLGQLFCVHGAAGIPAGSDAVSIWLTAIFFEQETRDERIQVAWHEAFLHQRIEDIANGNANVGVKGLLNKRVYLFLSSERGRVGSFSQ